MVKIRLQRFGGKKNPFYRVVAAHSTSPRDGRFIELLGTFNPVSYKFDTDLKADRIKYWIDHGAQPSETVSGILKKSGVIA